jgi:hypothetical protein
MHPLTRDERRWIDAKLWFNRGVEDIRRKMARMRSPSHKPSHRHSPGQPTPTHQPSMARQESAFAPQEFLAAAVGIGGRSLAR